MPDKFILVVDRGTGPQLNAVHEAVKAAAEGGWWHHFENTWIVTGRSASQWRDTATSALPKKNAPGVLVLRASEVAGGRWATGGGAKGADWLKKAFPPRKKGQPA